MKILDNKKLLGVGVLIIVLAVAAAGYFSSTRNQSLNTKPNYDPRNPSFVVGSVVVVGPNSLEISAGGQTYKVQINSDTRLTKQAMVGGTMSVVAASIGDFKIGSTVGVTFEKGGLEDNTTSGNLIDKATKIQLIK